MTQKIISEKRIPKSFNVNVLYNGVLAWENLVNGDKYPDCPVCGNFLAHNVMGYYWCFRGCHLQFWDTKEIPERILKNGVTKETITLLFPEKT